MYQNLHQLQLQVIHLLPPCLLHLLAPPILPRQREPWVVLKTLVRVQWSLWVIIRPPPHPQARRHPLPLGQRLAQQAIHLNLPVVSNQTVNWEVPLVGKSAMPGFGGRVKIVLIQKFVENFFLTKGKSFYIFYVIYSLLFLRF